MEYADSQPPQIPLANMIASGISGLNHKCLSLGIRTKSVWKQFDCRFGVKPGSHFKSASILDHLIRFDSCPRFMVQNQIVDTGTESPVILTEFYPQRH
jgi:hypothetical protein